MHLLLLIRVIIQMLLVFDRTLKLEVPCLYIVPHGLALWNLTHRAGALNNLSYDRDLRVVSNPSCEDGIAVSMETISAVPLVAGSPDFNVFDFA